MKKYNPFSSFDYLVDNLFTYQDKVEVKVFFLYRKKKVITRTLEIPKVKGKDEAYYLKEARRSFRQSIKDGSLNKYCKGYIKQKKKKKVLSVVIPFASACVLAGASFGIYYAITHQPIETKVFVPEIKGTSFSNTKAYIGVDYDTKISIDTTLTNYVLPDELTRITSDSRKVFEDQYTYTVSEDSLSATLHIPGKYVIGDIRIDFELIKLQWYRDSKYLNSLTKEDVTKENPDGTIGVVQTLKVNGLDHKVRLIGVDEDYGTIGDESTKIHTTWEFVNLISDTNGYSLATQWNDMHSDDYYITNHNYLNSSIRYALNKKTGEGGCDHILWAQKGATVWTTDPLYKDKCVLDMLPSDLVSVLKTPSKYVNIYNTTETKWEEKTVEDKLFLLSPKEMGDDKSAYQETYTTTYSYYKNTLWTDPKRIKKQVNNEVVYTEEPEIYDPASGQVYDDTVYNDAGYNASAGTTGYGAYYWLRSPYAVNSGSDLVWGVEEGGGATPNESLAECCAYPVAPAFCL